MVTWVSNPRVRKEESPRDMLFPGKLRPIKNPISKLTNNSNKMVSVSRGMPPEANFWSPHEGTWTHRYTHIHTPCTHTYYIPAFIYIGLYIYTYTHTHTNMYSEREKYHFCRTSFLAKKCSPILSVPELSICSDSKVAEWEIKPSSTWLQKSKAFSIAGQTALASHKENKSNERIELSTLWMCLRGGKDIPSISHPHSSLS